MLEQLLREFVSRSREILGDDLAGIYLHGSAAMDCFNPEKSDIDLITVINGEMSTEAKLDYLQMTSGLSSRGPAKGIEMSVVRKEYCDPFVYPTPYELHFSAGHLERYLRDPEAFAENMHGTDRDLAAHFTVIRNRGRCLYGAPTEEIFGEIPEEDYIDSVLYDIEDAPERITEDTMYFVLNLGRALAYRRGGSVLSKKEGGEWALENVPAEYHRLIRDALTEYTEGAEMSYDTAAAKRYAEYMLREFGNCTVPKG